MINDNIFIKIFTSSWLAYLIIAIAVFFLLREVFAWYWKINKIIDLLEKIEENTRDKTKQKVEEDSDK